MKKIFYIVFIFLLACKSNHNPILLSNKKNINKSGIELIVLGVAQDGGYPHIACKKKCCQQYWDGAETRKYVSCLAIVDHSTNQYWIFDATPDLGEQLKELQSFLSEINYVPSGILLTHAHIGHYAGLMYLGREAMGSKGIPVWVMPKMNQFLTNNGPWSQLISLKNIELKELNDQQEVSLSDKIKIIPLRVPHRDEFSETVGFRIVTPQKSVLFIPDIDKWDKWNLNIVEQVKKVNYAFIDATFCNENEISSRNIKEIPHPFVTETMELFKNEDQPTKNKIHFIHFNHTNPLLLKESTEKKEVIKNGYHISSQGMSIYLSE